MEYDSFCDNCGKRVPFNAHVCPYCRKEFKAIRCPACGHQGKPVNFLNGCPECGYMQSQDVVFPSAQPSKAGIQKADKKKADIENQQDGSFSGLRNPSASEQYKGYYSGYARTRKGYGNNTSKNKQSEKEKYESVNIPNWLTAIIISLLGVVLFILIMAYFQML